MSIRAAENSEVVTAGAQCLAASSATVALIVLSCLNAVHSPVFDCLRAGAQAWRLRKSDNAPLRIELATQLTLPRSHFVI